MPNEYENLEIDIIKKHQEINTNPSLRSVLYNKRGSIRSLFDKFLFMIKWYQKFIDSGFYRSWFEEFNEYWTKCLGGRPLYFHDFFFLYSWYRTRFQNVEIEDQNSLDSFVKAWIDSRNLYSTFGAVYKYALSPFQYYHFRKFLKNNSRVLEYGCGIAPIVAGLINDGKTCYNFTIADIQQFPYHYAKWRLKQFEVKFIDIDPKQLPTLEMYDTIFVMTVFEHLPNPLQVVKHLTDHLASGGYLIFDFLISHGHGLDTKQALEERETVLRYIEEHYTLIKGKIRYNEDMGNTVVQKK